MAHDRRRLRCRVSGVRAAAKAIAHRAATTFWSVALSVAGWILHPQLRTARFTGDDRVLAIAPHPDDETLGCGAALALHARAGDAVRAVAVTDGRASGAGGLGPVEMARRRSLEFRAALVELDVEGRELGLPEGEWSFDDGVARLAGLLAELDPTIVYAPPHFDYHPQHRSVARALGAALRRERSTARVRVYQVHVPLTAVLANVAVLADAAAAQRRRAEDAYGTQGSSVGASRRLAAQTRLVWRSAGAIEVFWELSAAAYADAASAVDPPTFRGLRERPFSDGLAWVMGLAERRRLRASAAYVALS
jgi:LmbE family N-acetylglucosaminyl deacetylase